MKKYITIIIILFLVLVPKRISALSSYVVMDSESGRVLGGSNINDKMLIASTTKIMTIIVALENANPTDIICAGEEIQKVYGSMIYIDEGECMILYDLLVGLMLRSGNELALTK